MRCVLAFTKPTGCHGRRPRPILEGVLGFLRTPVLCTQGFGVVRPAAFWKAGEPAAPQTSIYKHSMCERLADQSRILPDHLIMSN